MIFSKVTLDAWMKLIHYTSHRVLSNISNFHVPTTCTFRENSLYSEKKSWIRTFLKSYIRCIMILCCITYRFSQTCTFRSLYEVWNRSFSLVKTLYDFSKVTHECLATVLSNISNFHVPTTCTFRENSIYSEKCEFVRFSLVVKFCGINSIFSKVTLDVWMKLIHYT